MNPWDINFSRSEPAMMLREWRGRVPHEKASDYLELLKQTGMKDYAAVDGHLQTIVAVDSEGDAAEFLVITLWESREAIERFAPDDIRLAKYYPQDSGFLLDMPRYLRNYRVMTIDRS